MRGRATTGLRRLLDDTLLTGALALLVCAVALAIAYRAEDGLPLAATYRVHADVPDADKLAKNADVRIGGARVGQVLAIRAEPGDGRHPPYAQLDLQLDASAGPLPARTTAEVRLASVLGGKFLDLDPGTGPPGRTIPDGGTIPLANGRLGIDTDQALQVFQPASRAAIRAMIGGLADGLAGRGGSVNEALAATARSLPAAQRVLGVLVSARADLPGLVAGLARTAHAVAPVAGELGEAIDRGATTMAAIEAAGPQLDELLGALPAAEQQGTAALVAARPVLADAAAITRSLAPAGRVLRSSLQRVDAVMDRAAPIDVQVGTLAKPLDAALGAVDRFARDPATEGAIVALHGQDLATFGGSAFVGLGAILNTVSDAQLHCNVAGIWMRNLASTASEGDSGGNWLRMIPVFATDQTSHVAAPAADLHVNPYPNEDAQECEAGNEPYGAGQAIGNPPGRQSGHVDTTTAAGAGG